MSKVAHIVGNGDAFKFFKQPDKGLIMTCNLPPVENIKNVYATAIVDFKMCNAIREGSINLSMFDWVMGARPKRFTEMHPDFYLKHSRNIKEFYLDLNLSN